MKHIISFRRPELRHVLATMTVPSEGGTLSQIHRLEDLGYKIIAVTPPLNTYGPPQNPLMHLPELLAVSEAKTSVRRAIV